MKKDCTESCSCLLLSFLDVFFHLRILLWRPRAKNGGPHSDFVASHGNGTLKVRTHSHTQLQLFRTKTEFLGYVIPRVSQHDEILILRLRSGRLRASDGADSHEAGQLDVGTLLPDVATQRGSVLGLDSALGLLTRGVDLNQNAQHLLDLFFFAFLLLLLHKRLASLLQLIGFLGRVDARDAPQVGDLLGQRLALVGLQGPDEVPSYAAGQDGGLFLQFLEVILAEVVLGVRRGSRVQGQDVGGRLQLRDGNEADLEGGRQMSVYGAARNGTGFRGWMLA